MLVLSDGGGGLRITHKFYTITSEKKQFFKTTLAIDAFNDKNELEITLDDIYPGEQVKLQEMVETKKKERLEDDEDEIQLQMMHFYTSPDGQKYNLNEDITKKQFRDALELKFFQDIDKVLQEAMTGM